MKVRAVGFIIMGFDIVVTMALGWRTAVGISLGGTNWTIITMTPKGTRSVTLLRHAADIGILSTTENRTARQGVIAKWISVGSWTRSPGLLIERALAFSSLATQIIRAVLGDEMSQPAPTSTSTANTFITNSSTLGLHERNDQQQWEMPKRFHRRDWIRLSHVVEYRVAWLTKVN
ncbi:hypothetical protein HG530_000745 [Fusarium avenaceum]|nr:hypothetical protein HG530_000745 [Fusarium avenaceum]